MANLADVVSKQLPMRTEQVSRIHVLGLMLDELKRNLDRIEALEDSIVEKRKYRELQELKGKAEASVTRLRDALAKQGGQSIAKGYK
ncbi:hypothetical protein [Salinifilum ghardaiensis]